MNEDTKDKKVSKPKAATIVLGILLAAVIVLVGGLIIGDLNKREVSYKLGEIAFELPNQRAEYIGVNKDQVIRITKDGITAYNLKGQEVWTDTLTLDNVVVKEKEPYFAVANMKDKRISIFSDKGKEGDIYTDATILYFSINKNGDVATIEETKDGHIIGAYDKTGTRIPGRRVTHIESAGYPIAVEVSLDRELLLASYVDIYSPLVTTNVVGVYLDVAEEQAVDNIKFGVEAKDNLIYEIEYVNDTTWAAIGDQGIIYYDQSGKVVTDLGKRYLKYTPYVSSGLSVGYLPIIESTIQGDNIVYGKQTLSLIDASGGVIYTEDLEKAVTYFYADEVGVILGQGKDYTGYSRKGEKRFTFHATQDIEGLRYIGKKLVALTKNEVIWLEEIKEVQ